MLKFAKILTVIIAISLLVTGCGTKNSEPLSKTQFIMDTYSTITIYDNSSQKLIDESFTILKDVNDMMSNTIPTSDISKVNAASGENFVKVSDDTFYVVEKALNYSKLTDGRFDITIGPIVRLWNIGTDKARVPSQDEIKEKLPLVNYKNVLLDKSNKEIMLKNKGMILDLGAIAKGFAADKLVSFLKSKGVTRAIINLGGNVYTIGSRPGGGPWKIGIQNPFSSRGDYMGIVKETGKTVVTSGVYERYFIKDGKRYHHILNPFTGYPYDNSLYSVTVVTNKSTDADALSTSLFTLGLENGMKFAKEHGIEAIFITSDKKVYITPGLKNTFTITDPSFKLSDL